MAPALLVLSPHYDDAVLSCGRVLAAHPGATVATACTAPAPPGPVRDWDRGCGFGEGDDVMAARQAEDAAALAVVGAHQLRLGQLDSQYLPTGSRPPDDPALEAAVAQVVAEAVAADASTDADANADAHVTVLLPLGIHHPDHVALRQAAMTVSSRVPARWLVYEDLPYGRVPELAAARRAAFAAFVGHELLLMPAALPAVPDLEVKLQAVGRYRSQVELLGALFNLPEVLSTEAYWELVARDHVGPAQEATTRAGRRRARST